MVGSPKPTTISIKQSDIGTHFTFCFFWAVLTAVSLSVDALFWYEIFDTRLTTLIILAFIAAFVTAAIAIWIEQYLTSKRPAITRFSAMFILLSVGTMGATYLASALYTIPFLLPSMELLTSVDGWFDILYFFLAHGYSFAATTARQFLPLGVVSVSIACIFYCVIHAEPVQKPRYGIEP